MLVLDRSLFRRSVSRRMLRHDGGVLLPPFLFHLFELRLADHVLDPGTEMVAHPAHFPDPTSGSAQSERKIFRADRDHRDDHDQQKLGRADVEHWLALDLRAQALPPSRSAGDGTGAGAETFSLAAGAAGACGWAGIWG